MINRKAILSIFVLLLTVCSNKNTVKGEIPPPMQLSNKTIEQIEEKEKELTKELDQKKTDTSTFIYNYEVFRVNKIKRTALKYTITNKDFFGALEAEFDVFALSRKNNLITAIKKYNSLTKKIPKEKGFLVQRIAICYYKLKEYNKANKYLNAAIKISPWNSELAYYKTLLLSYYNKDFNKAAVFAGMVDTSDVFINSQDFLYLHSFIENKAGNKQKVLPLLKKSIDVQANNFYLHYNPLQLLIDIQAIDFAKDYIKKSSDYLISLDMPKYRKKAYSQIVDLNRYLKKNTFIYRFALSKQYDFFPNIMFFGKSPGFIKRDKTFHLDIPLKEKKEHRRDAVYYALHESIVDYKNNSGLFLVMGSVLVTNVRYKYDELHTPVRRLVFYSNKILLLSPTNIYVIITNTAVNTNHPEYVATNQSNVIFSADIDCKYYIDTFRCDVDNDKNWDYGIVGFNSTNQGVLTVYYPSLDIVKKTSFTLKTHNAKLVIQDINDDGSNEIILLDDDAYFLNTGLK